MSRIKTFFRDIPGGAGINLATVQVKRHVDDVVVIGGTTGGTGAAAGGVAFTRAQIGYPGPVYSEAVGNGQRKVDSGTVITQTGAFWLDDIPDALSALGQGPISGLVPSANGSSMALFISAGSGIFKDGIPYVQEASANVGTVTAADPSNPRIDRLVLRETRRGQAEEGKFQWVIIAGTAAASPTPPNLVQTASSWDYSFAQVRVEAGVATIAPSKVTDERFSATLSQQPIPQIPLMGAGDLIYMGADGILHTLAAGLDDQILTVNNASQLPDWEYQIDRGHRGFFRVVDSQSAANTGSTSNTATTVQAIQTAVTLPGINASRWTVQAVGGLALKRDVAGSSFFTIEVEADAGSGNTLAISTTDYQAVTTSRNVTNMPGNQGINVRVRYCSNTSGLTSARNPWLDITLERTA